MAIDFTIIGKTINIMKFTILALLSKNTHPRFTPKERDPIIFQQSLDFTYEKSYLLIVFPT